MGSFDLGGGRIALVRNHELHSGQEGTGVEAPSGYRRDADGKVMPGGTTTLVRDAATLRIERQFRSLASNVRNCAGGITPWCSWLSCEQPGFFMRRAAVAGYVFEES